MHTEIRIFDSRDVHVMTVSVNDIAYAAQIAELVHNHAVDKYGEPMTAINILVRKATVRQTMSAEEWRAGLED